MTRARLDILGEFDDGLSGKLFQVLGVDVAGEVTDGETGETEVESGVLLDEGLALLVAVLAHLDFGGRELLVQRGIGGDRTLVEEV